MPLQFFPVIPYSVLPRLGIPASGISSQQSGELLNEHADRLP
jgi:hypothetical protein